MYWTVMGCVMAMESTVEWIFAWYARPSVVCSGAIAAQPADPPLARALSASAGSRSTTSARRSSSCGSRCPRSRCDRLLELAPRPDIGLRADPFTLSHAQGSTYIYVAHVQPFLAAHESDIDAAVANAKVRAKAAGVEWLNTAVQRIRQAVVGTLAVSCLCVATHLSFVTDTRALIVPGASERPAAASSDDPPPADARRPSLGCHLAAL